MRRVHRLDEVWHCLIYSWSFRVTFIKWSQLTLSPTYGNRFKSELLAVWMGQYDSINDKTINSGIVSIPTLDLSEFCFRCEWRIQNNDGQPLEKTVKTWGTRIPLFFFEVSSWFLPYVPGDSGSNDRWTGFFVSEILSRQVNDNSPRIRDYVVISRIASLINDEQ